MRFAFDIDGTISAAPEVFSVLTEALIDQGHIVYILTGTMDEVITPEHYRKRYQQLRDLKIKYSFLQIVNAPGHVQAKADYCKQQNIAMMFEDSKVYADAINKAGTLCLLMP